LFHALIQKRCSKRMTISLSAVQKKWLWLLLGVWLLVLQSMALSHAAVHAQEQDHAQCLQCTVDDNPAAGPAAVLMPPTLLQRAEYIAFPLFSAPALAWLSKLNVRAPPFLF